MDLLGRIIESKANVAANGTLRIGSNYRPGIYLAEVLQGKQKVIVKLVKAAQ